MLAEPDPNSSSSFHEEMPIRVTDRLPTEDETPRVRHLVLQRLAPSAAVTDDRLAEALKNSPHLESVVLSGVPETTDRTVVLLAQRANNLQGLNLSNCTQVTDVSILELANKALPLQWLILNGVTGLTDPSISAIAKSCSRLAELELCDLPLLTPLAVRDIWSFSRKLRTLRLANCPLLTDKAFPAPLSMIPTPDPGEEPDKPPPHTPATWIEELPSLFLRHTADNLRVLDLSSCNKITDNSIDGIVTHAPRIQSLILSGCSLLTDASLDSICKLGDHLDVLMLAHVSNITDRAVVQVARSCPNLRCIDVAFCRNLTDMSVFELAGLGRLRRLSLVRVHKITDIAIFTLAEHATHLERLHLSFCDGLSLDAIHLLLQKLGNLQHLTATGIPSIRRKGVERFSELPPPNCDPDQRAAFRVFTGDKVVALRKFLDKEERRRREQ
ncbi:SCF E3 ubiquitin ligase complex F-box protein grrA [Coprinopsis cinerea okayama7|uniref:SCF E3 ubiquitin ligase complex F-box protein grrA n=1 Tax=Coprinopsis cinerea (strain Okayama-7 / 130 / ATCC MYA-4618 / FGSC 9003) TaxID=240176 RepID=A8NYK7_COPC7|nr:SCF E3 ubiquitin ligase complex F-box protein grrA [Coprinopsis cinerea okayama7\|eukprot:XP_001837453.2 SCF E3 ubiquitin ligase complex F-box protein grrA [Coprinopsis cinerea okayama7\